MHCRFWWQRLLTIALSAMLLAVLILSTVSCTEIGSGSTEKSASDPDTALSAKENSLSLPAHMNEDCYYKRTYPCDSKAFQRQRKSAIEDRHNLERFDLLTKRDSSADVASSVVYTDPKTKKRLL